MDNLQKSHSKSSNAKLTIICLFLALSISAVFISLSLYGKIQDLYFYLSVALSGFLALFFLGVVVKFRR